MNLTRMKQRLNDRLLVLADKLRNLVGPVPDGCVGPIDAQLQAAELAVQQVEALKTSPRLQLMRPELVENATAHRGQPVEVRNADDDSDVLAVIGPGGEFTRNIRA